MKKFYFVSQFFLIISAIFFLAPKSVEAQNTGSNTSFTFTAPAGVTCVVVEAWGGGGKGGTRTSGGDGGGGGGGGGAYSKGILSVVPGNNYDVFVGAGATTTSPGGDSYFVAMNSSYVGAKGGNSVADNSNTGASGGAAASGFGSIKASGGTGGTGSNNTTTAGGGGGGSSAGPGSDGNGANGGNGGSSPSTSGGTPPTGGGAGGAGASTIDNPGAAGTAPGGGGGGAWRNNGTVNGGNGAAGYVKITWFDAFSAGAISTTGQTICYNTTPSIAIGSTTAASGGDGNYTYQWQYSTDNTFTTGVTTVSSNTATYTPAQTLTQTTYYRRQAKDNTCNTTFTSSTNIWTVTVRNQFTAGAIATSGQTICYNATPTTQIGSTTAASGGDGTITYQWQYSTDNTFNTGVTTVSSNTATYTPTQTLTQTTYYRRQAKDNTCNTTFTSSTNIWTVTVRNQFTAGAIATTGQTICYNTTPTTQIGSTTAASGGDGTITYQWQYSTDNMFTTGVTTVSSNTATYTPTQALTQTTYYRRQAKDGTCNTTFTSSANTWTVTVRSQFTAGEIANTGESVCSNAVPVTTIGSTTAADGGDGSITYQWQYSTDITFTTGVNTVSVNTATYTPTQTLTQTTYYRRQAHDGTCNTGWTTSANTWTVTVNPSPAFTTSNAVNVSCFGGTDGSIQVNITGGVDNSPYTFSISNGTGGYTQPYTGSYPAYTLGGLSAGTLKIRIKDKYGCASASCD